MIKKYKNSLLIVVAAITFSACSWGTKNLDPNDLSGVPGVIQSDQGTTETSEGNTYSTDPFTSSFAFEIASLPSSLVNLKPADSETPAAGICMEVQGDPVLIILGFGSDGIPLAGRCLKISPEQRIQLINHSTVPISTELGEFKINLAVNSALLLDNPVGQYLGTGVHFLSMGPELWVNDEHLVLPGSLPVEYNNTTFGYNLKLPNDWIIDENGMINGTNGEVAFMPPSGEPFISYLSISQEFRPLEQVIQSYAQYYPDAVREDVKFNGYLAVKYIFPGGRNEFFYNFGNQLLLIATDKPEDPVVQSILSTVRFTFPPQPIIYEAIMADSGKTLVMNVGDKLRLNLDYGYTWATIRDFDPGILMGASEGYFALSRGTTALTMVGNPLCLNSTPPCGMPSVMYTITVNVQ